MADEIIVPAGDYQLTRFPAGFFLRVAGGGVSLVPEYEIPALGGLLAPPEPKMPFAGIKAVIAKCAPKLRAVAAALLMVGAPAAGGVYLMTHSISCSALVPNPEPKRPDWLPPLPPPPPTPTPDPMARRSESPSSAAVSSPAVPAVSSPAAGAVSLVPQATYATPQATYVAPQPTYYYYPSTCTTGRCR